MVHRTSTRVACALMGAPVRLRRSGTRFALAVANLQRSVRRGGVKLSFWPSMPYACQHPGHTLLWGVLDQATTCALCFVPVLQVLISALHRTCCAQTTQVACALHTRAHTIQTRCLSTLPETRAFCASSTVWHCVPGPCFGRTFSVLCTNSAEQVVAVAPPPNARATRCVWLALLHSLSQHRLPVFVCRASACG